MADNYNVKHPIITFDGTYPYLHVTSDAAGGQILKSIQPGMESHFEVQPSGSYHGHAADGSKVEVTANGHWQYHGNGHSTTTDGNHDHKVSGVTRQNHDGGKSTEVNGDDYHGGAGHKIIGTADTQYHHSSGDVFNTVDGNLVADRVGDVHENIFGDHVKQITGNRFDMISGEWGINSQDGNVDMQIDNGKLRIKSSGNILINSDSTITLQVGSQTIVITSSGITINASAVKFVKV